MRTAWRTFAAVATAILLVALGAAITHQVGGGAFSLSLAIPVVVWLAVEAGIVEGAVAAAAVGVILDAAAGGPAGLLTFLSVALFLVARAGAAALGARGVLGMTLLSALGGFLVGFLALLLLRYVSPPAAMPGWGLLGRVVVEALLSALATPGVRWLLDRVGAPVPTEEPGALG
jgi:hypothetical protein